MKVMSKRRPDDGDNIAMSSSPVKRTPPTKDRSSFNGKAYDPGKLAVAVFTSTTSLSL